MLINIKDELIADMYDVVSIVNDGDDICVVFKKDSKELGGYSVVVKNANIKENLTLLMVEGSDVKVTRERV